MLFRRYMVVCFAALTLTSCQNDLDTPADEMAPAVEMSPVKVEVRSENGAYKLYRAGEPYNIKGAGLEFGNIEKLAEHGGNSFRTWRTENGQQTGMEVLDRAHENGLTVTMGIEIARERHGFDYDDEEAVARQLEEVREQILLYRDHPALLIWGIGNELNLRATNPKVWDAVNDISEMIHELDPNHPTTTSLAGIGKDLVDDIKERAPDLDLLSVQMYADIVNLPRYINESDWTGPYMVTEWGATGHWEVALAPWGAPIENTSSVKADAYLARYKTAIESDTTQCLGSYVFLWGQKQERTPTWYGIFLSTGEETESIDVMHYIWNSTWPENRTPRLTSATLTGRTAYDGITLKPGTTYEAEALVTDYEGDSISYHWEIKRESTDLGDGGDFETTPPTIPNLISDAAVAQISMSTPAEEGAYRLFVYAYDGQGHAAHANIPFLVEN